MITQKSLHLKTNITLLKYLDEYTRRSWKSRNMIINDAIRSYLNEKNILAETTYSEFLD